MSSRRRRETPWMHRRSRYLIAAVALLGAINTGYLTVTKLLGGETTCPTEGCEQVLSSPYAYVLGLPLALFGFLAYVSIIVFALAPLTVSPEKNKQLRTNLENWTWLLLFAGTTAMLVFSGYLMYIMFSQFVIPYGVAGICVFCVASALFALTLFILTLLGRAWEDVGQLVFTGVIVGMVTIVGTLGVYANANLSNSPGTTAEGPAGPPVTTTSGESEIALAQHLTAIGAKMYGAYWCPHCHDQKLLFGKQAFDQVTYVECSPNGGPGSQPLQECIDRAIEGYPTWEVNGELYSGTQTLEQLADFSGYQGPRNFQNQG
ncbi:MAG: vitamin K epoxide reductase family protein [Cyanobacteria bacterium CRU_2_1]|nr:vitamin K epoxide reductase family protein [Cyanobacteria bacterium RU_5_0]NJR61535.1 vitamin K epoxide reductase family protein [Cyanobacteria bacterium CRU_2_1]